MLYAQLEGQAFSEPIGKIVCVGRNYADHAAELNNPVPDSPLLFIKPGCCAVNVTSDFTIPTEQGEVHHELEIALLMGETPHKDDDIVSAIAGVGLALDLTLRDVQQQLKSKGHPWERAKAFAGACPLTEFVAAEQVEDWQALTLSLHRNGQLQQHGCSRDMLFPIEHLLSDIHSAFGLQAGDVVLTGTPAGVGPLAVGDELLLSLNNWLEVPLRVGAQHESL
ncbi:hypothetical protein GCM10011297_19350 [Bacterioplanes sanyensis]|uniref:fumarylacetoacetate hydrolase family protein n=1 Tax=Bacterioplanes sanyensis TaxID=1249553 RepID=UPI00167A48EA|nr:fumarylacetoacetate hydrolase family protein [Bacterioplanes sanyensis]GGY46636.1 hypothetical protein GCM10011297_19350 [Bacterioplanes sanyensis]